MSASYHWNLEQTGHGLRTANEAFLIKIPNFWAWINNLVDKFCGIWGIFGQTISTYFDTVCHLSMFSIIQPLFLQKIRSLYPNPIYLLRI